MESSRTQFEVLGLEAYKSSKMPCPRLEYSTIFWLVENGPRSWPTLLSLEERQTVCKKLFEEIRLPGERLNFPENWRNFATKTLLFCCCFFENAWVFRKIYKILELKTFFLRSLSRCVVGFWPLASSIHVLGLKKVCPRKGCPWPWRQIFFVFLASSLVSSTLSLNVCK